VSIFDDPDVQLEVDGIEVDPQELDQEIRDDANVGRVSWAVVERWCVDHPGRVRLIPGKYAQVTTQLRARYPHLTVRAFRHRPRSSREPGRGNICDVLVTFVPEGEVSPFADGVPGVEYRVTKATGRWDGNAARP
jgi:hypothetical protein